MFGIFQLGHFYYYTSFPFITTYAYYLVHCTNDDLPVGDEEIGKMLVVVIIYNISSILGIIFEVIINTRLSIATKNHKGIAIKSQEDFNREKAEKYKYYKLKKFLHYAVVISLDTITTFWFSYQSVLVKLINKPVYIDTIKRMLLIIFCVLFSYLILDIKIQKYQKFALFVCFIGFLLNFTISIINDFSHDSNQILAIFIELLNNFLSAIMVVEEKMLMHYYFQSPYIIIFYQGIIGCAGAMASLFFYRYVIMDDSKIKDFNTIQSWIFDNLGHIMAFIVVTLGYSVMRFLVNKTTTPTHRLIYDTCIVLLKHVIKMLRGNIQGEDFGFLIGYILLVLGSLIYHEVIVVVIWGLKKDTRTEVIKRERIEHENYTAQLKSLNKEDYDDEEVI